ncbi:hypothetical protein J6590_105581, partial [Homalodisca vitripennis]
MEDKNLSTSIRAGSEWRPLSLDDLHFLHVIRGPTPSPLCGSALVAYRSTKLEDLAVGNMSR